MSKRMLLGIKTIIWLLMLQSRAWPAFGSPGSDKEGYSLDYASKAAMNVTGEEGSEEKCDEGSNGDAVFADLYVAFDFSCAVKVYAIKCLSIRYLVFIYPF